MLRSVQRIVLLGAGGVGKSAIVQQYTRGQIPTRYTPTVEDLYQHQVDVTEGNSITIEILDTAGHHRFPAMRELAIRSGQAFVVVYAVDSKQSYEEAMTILNMIRSTKGEISTYVALIGNKKNSSECHRHVCRAEAERQAAQLGCAFTETHATCSADIQAIFTGLIHTLYALEVTNTQRRARRKSSLKDRLLSIFGNARNPKDLIEETESPLEINLERRASGNTLGLLNILRRRSSANNNNNNSRPTEKKC